MTSKGYTFKFGGRYRHAYSLDIDMVVAKNLGEDGDSISMLVLYWNRFYNGYAVEKYDTVTVKREDVPRWELIEEDFL